jgi:hypothetical protein
MLHHMKHHLIILCDRYGAHLGLTKWQIGRRAMKNVRFFHDLKCGRGCTLATYERAMVWFGEEWPADLAWPEGVPRLATPRTSRSRDDAAVSELRQVEADLRRVRSKLRRVMATTAEAAQPKAKP